MKELNELIHKALETKLEDGSFDKILSEYIDKAMKNLLEQMFERSWNTNNKPHGEAYAYIEEAVRPLIMQSLEQCNLRIVAEKTKQSINAIIQQCSIAQMGKTLNAALGIFSEQEELKYGQSYSMKNILKTYVKMLEEDTYTYDKDWFEDHEFEIDEGSCCLECRMDVEDIESRNGSLLESKKLVRLYIDTLDEDDDNNVIIEFTISKDYQGKWRPEYKAFQPLGFDEIANMNSVELLIRKLESNNCYLTDVKSDDDEAEFRDLYE